MKPTHPFCYAPNCEMMFGADRHEIVGYDGFDESPIWIAHHEEDVRFLFASNALVVAVGNATVSIFGLDGLLRTTLDLPESVQNPIAADFAEFADICAIATENEAWFLNVADAQTIRQLSVREIKNISMSDDGDALTIDQEGAVRLYDEGILVETLTSHTFETASWSEHGWWLADANHIYLWDMVENPRPVYTAEETIEDLFATSDGHAIAVRLSPNIGRAISNSGALLGEMQYYDREAGAMAIIDDVFAVGIDLADANKLMLRTGMLHRSDTHPERSHNSWMCNLRVDANAVETWWNQRQLAAPVEQETSGLSFKEQLDRLHEKLLGLPNESIGEHLRTSPLPEELEDALYAAQRTIPFLESASVDAEPARSAAIRLRAIKRILEMLPNTPQSIIVMQQIDEAVEKSEKKARNDTIIGCGCLILIAAIVIAGVGMFVF